MNCFWCESDHKNFYLLQENWRPKETMAHVAATATPTRYDTPGLGPKKTFFVLVTVVGCIAILWPKVFYPMLMGGGQEKQLMNDYRGSGKPLPIPQKKKKQKNNFSNLRMELCFCAQKGCCDVVLDSDEFANVSSTLSSMEHPKIFRKNINLFTGEISKSSTQECLPLRQSGKWKTNNPILN